MEFLVKEILQLNIASQDSYRMISAKWFWFRYFGEGWTGRMFWTNIAQNFAGSDGDLDTHENFK